jgi:hypothetical protein
MDTSEFFTFTVNHLNYDVKNFMFFAIRESTIYFQIFKLKSESSCYANQNKVDILITNVMHCEFATSYLLIQ